MTEELQAWKRYVRAGAALAKTPVRALRNPCCLDDLESLVISRELKMRVLFVYVPCQVFPSRLQHLTYQSRRKPCQVLVAPSSHAQLGATKAHRGSRGQ